ncbi:MAG: class I SAM-dependent methyltransferase [Chloroflexi bacterium]|nr:class I SAM-dependent methyltransferase [Chloroflexota bacterium]MCI0578031.1 class I SAM-dependent methyltransferase [Chloroflexota bacterium]MCI0644755.1 class I SAM-dependent methyltransferase [Chloroflexota bacterium]MCI0728660.1 class I SAM-dependent methyltransferase [Chloroflexota bacterium]
MANFFSEGSPFLHHPLLTPERTAAEVEFAMSCLALSPGARLLDVGCGFGRHSIELARRGYQVVGIDPSAAMIASARERAAAAGVAVHFVRAGGESFTAGRPFDAAICLFTTLGQITESGENSGLVANVFAALRPGARFLVEVPQREAAVAGLKAAEQFGQGERYTAVTRHFDPAGNSVTERFAVVSPEETRHYLLRYRLYTWPELANLLEAAGFTLLAGYGGYDGRPLASESPIMLALGGK